MMRSTYDTVQAFRGHDIYKTGIPEGAGGDKAGFPSGGAIAPRPVSERRDERFYVSGRI